MFGKMSVGVWIAARPAENGYQEGENDKSIRPPQRDLNDPHVGISKRKVAAAPWPAFGSRSLHEVTGRVTGIAAAG